MPTPPVPAAVPAAAPGVAPLTLPSALGRAVHEVVLHCSATASGQALKGGAAATIDRWHRERGFQRHALARRVFNPGLPAIGYHYVVDIDGRVHTGRHPNEVGAHVAGHNAGSIGVCLVGGVERVALYTAPQWAALRTLVQLLLPLCAQPARVLGHRDLSPDADGDGRITPRDWLKTCPGFDVRAWLSSGMQPPRGHLWPAGV